MSHTNSWLVRHSSPQSAARLFCFPFAGGSASAYSSWRKTLHPSIEICAIELPGRGRRYKEQPHTSIAPLVEGIALAIQDQPLLPFAFFGHSMGSILAFEVARYLKRHDLPLPKKLLLSGRAAPHHRGPSKSFHTLDDEALIKVLRDYNGTPQQVLDNKELMKFLLPTIRADFSVLENYRYCSQAPLEIPLITLAGRSDSHVTSEQMAGWRAETTFPSTTRWFDGDHFFIQSHSSEVIHLIDQELSDVLLKDQLLM